MTANIYSHTHLIGTADLKIGDASMGGLYCIFSPNDIYFSLIQKHVWQFGEPINLIIKNGMH
jgi:hypothetical protein